MAQEYNDGLLLPPPTVSALHDGKVDALPGLQFGTVEEELPSEARERVHETLPVELEPGWHTIKTRLQSVYGGKLPYVSRDVSAFSIDLWIERPSSCSSYAGQALPTSDWQQWLR